MPWLERAWRQVQARLAEDRLPHALILNGERGVGKRAWAEAVAGLLLCETPAGRHEGRPVACGTCKQCELVMAGSHPDLRVYAPETSRMIKVDQIRALSAFAVASPQVAHHKVAIIDRADQLNVNAANALLKTLEEPLPDVTLLLLQETGRPVLPTIRSRCQTLMVPVPSMAQAEQWLARALDGLGGDTPAPPADRVRRALALADRAPRLALEYLTGDFLELRDTAFDAFRRFMRGEMPVADAARPSRPWAWRRRSVCLRDGPRIWPGWRRGVPWPTRTRPICWSSWPGTTRPGGPTSCSIRYGKPAPPVSTTSTRSWRRPGCCWPGRR